MATDSNGNPAYYQFSKLANVGDGKRFSNLLNNVSKDDRDQILSYLTRSLLMTENDLHQINFFHRDLKKDNLLIHYDPKTRMMSFRISDFGLGTLYDENNQLICGGSAFNVQYAPPEVIEVPDEKERDYYLDLWRTGLTYLELTSPKAEKFVQDHFLKDASWHINTPYKDKYEYYERLFHSPELPMY